MVLSITNSVILNRQNVYTAWWRAELFSDSITIDHCLIQARPGITWRSTTSGPAPMHLCERHRGRPRTDRDEHQVRRRC